MIATHCYCRLLSLIGSFAALPALLISTTVIANEAEPDIAAARRRLERARVHLKFGIVEHGNLAEFDAAQRELAGAEHVPSLAAEVNAQRAEVEQLREASRTSFDSRFPLVRAVDAERQTSDLAYVAPSALLETAPRLAVHAAVSQLAKELPNDLSDAVVFVYPNRVGEAPTAECRAWIGSQTAALLGSLPNVNFHPETIDAQATGLPAWEAPDAAFAPACQAAIASFGPNARPRNLVLLLVRVRSPLPTDEYLFHAQCRVFDADAIDEIMGGDAAKAESSMYLSDGLCRDASGRMLPLVASQALLLLLAIAGYAALLAVRRLVVSNGYDWFVPPLIGYLLGFTLPHAVMSFMQRFVPSPGTGWLNATWWPCLAGAFALLLPSVVLRVGARSMAVVPGARRLDGRWGAALASVALGVAAFWCGPAVIYLGRDAIAVLLPFTLAGAMLSYCFGRAIDPGDHFPLGAAALAIVLALPLGAAIFLASPVITWACALAVLAFTAAGTRRAPHGQAAEAKPTGSRSAGEHDSVPSDLVELRARAGSAFYVPAEALQQARDLCRAGDGRRTIWTAVCGPTGSGKTALVERLMADLAGSDGPVRVLLGDCRAESPPYQAFREALAEVWETVAPASVQPEAAGIDTVFQELAGLFVPYWDLLSAVAGPGEHAAVSPSDLHAAVAKALGKLAKKQRVVLCIDNVQWLDDGSAALVRHLHRHFEPSGPAPLTILLVAREPADLQKLDLAVSLVTVAPPLREQQIAMLEGVLGFEPQSARAIVKSLGAVSEEPGGVFWLSRTLGQLLDEDAVVPSEHGFALRPEFLKPGKLPLPGKLREALADRLRQSSDDLLVVQCAALLGHVFRVSVLAASLRKDRLELLQVLHRLEHESRLFEDVIERDDEYAFSSLFMYQVVRELLKLDGDEGTVGRPRKIVMELYAHIARALESAESLSASDVFELADRYCQAGSLYAAKAMDYALRASRVARSQFGYQAARRYLAMAATAGETAGKSFDEERESLIIDCDEAHVTGRNRLPVAERGWQYVASRHDADKETALLIARTCYDAGRDSGSGEWFEHAAGLAKGVLDSAASEIERAEAGHLLGISLPVAQRVERTAHLRRALETVECAPTSRGTLLLKARLLGSLAEQLSYGTSGEREEAKALFERGLDLRVAGGLGDLPGQARAQGGLGRLAFFGDPPNHDAARRHFLADLAIAEQLDDAAGQSIAHSFLGKCELAANELARALAHFAAAKEHAQSTKDTLFALAGMLECSLLLGHNDEADRTGEELARLAGKAAIPPDCAEEIVRVLKAATQPGSRSWVDALARS